MATKQSLIDDLRNVFAVWQRLLAEMKVEDISARPASGKWSVAQVVTHLFGWLQVSVARVEAALGDREPDLPAWLGGADPFYAEEHVDEFNARMQQLHHDEPWPSRERAWRDLFDKFLKLVEDVPASVMTDSRRFAWLRGAPLSAVLEGASEHHWEHLERVRAELGRT